MFITLTNSGIPGCRRRATLPPRRGGASATISTSDLGSSERGDVYETTMRRTSKRTARGRRQWEWGWLRRNSRTSFNLPPLSNTSQVSCSRWITPINVLTRESWRQLHGRKPITIIIVLPRDTTLDYIMMYNKLVFTLNQQEFKNLNNRSTVIKYLHNAKVEPLDFIPRWKRLKPSNWLAWMILLSLTNSIVYTKPGVGLLMCGTI